MTEHDAFEVRFGAAVHRYVGRVSSDLDPVDFAHRVAAQGRRHGFAAALAHAIAVRPRGWRFSWTLGWSQLPSLGWLLLLAGLLVAAVVGTTVGARLLSSALPTTVPSVVPSPYPVLTGTPELTWMSRAVSGDELWTMDHQGAASMDYQGLWHYVGDAWQGPLSPPLLDGEMVSGLALGPDGALWVSGETTVAVLRDGVWRVAWKAAAGETLYGLVVSNDGTVWVSRGLDLVGLAREGAGYTARSVECPTPISRIATTTDGAVYVGGYAYAGGLGLARSDGTTCTLVDPLGDGQVHEVSDLSAGPGGSLLATVLDDDGGALRVWVVLLRDGRWSTISGPTVEPSLSVGQAIAPDGHPWRIDGDLGLERYEGGVWRVVAASARSLAMAPDGVLWYETDLGVIERIRTDQVGN